MGRMIYGEDRKSMIRELTAQLEAIGLEPVLCGSCGNFENWPTTETEDPIGERKKAEDLQLDCLFCMCD